MNNFDQINVENLLYKVEKFYKSFYINKLIKGLLTAIGIVLAFFLLFNVIFYYGSIPSVLRYAMFYGFFVILSFCFFYWIVVPISRLFRIRNGMSIEQSSVYIGKYYNEIGDKLLNVIQVAKFSDTNSLAGAAIAQHNGLFEKFDFEKAAPVAYSKVNVSFFLVPVMIFLSLTIFNSNVLIEGTERFVNYESDYSKIAPFKFSFLENRDILQGSNVALNVTLAGDHIPNELWILINGSKFKMMRSELGFTFVVNNVRSSFDFLFTDGIFQSTTGNVIVEGLPEVSKTVMEVKYPLHVNKPDAYFRDVSILELPEGSSINFEAICSKFEFYELRFNEEILTVKEVNGVISSSFEVEEGVLSLRLGKDSYSSVVYSCEILVVSDEYPVIIVESNIDKDSNRFFSGVIMDDYGFKGLEVIIISKDAKLNIPIPFKRTGLSSDFQYMVEIESFNEDIEVTFVVTDNDAINGYKSTYSTNFRVNIQSDEELLANTINEYEDLDKELEKIKEKSKLVSKELDGFDKMLTEKDKLSWLDQEKLKAILNQKMDINASVRDVQKRMKKLNRSEDKNANNENSAKQKQKQLNELLESLVENQDEELLRELEKLLAELNKDDLREQLNKLEDNQKEYDKELERDLEIFKQMRLDQLFEDSKMKLDSIKKDLDKLIMKEDGSDANVELAKQEELNERFENLKKELESVDSLNKELETPLELNMEKELQDSISKDLEDAKKSGEGGDSKEAKSKQEDAAKKMDALSEKMESSMSGGGSSQEGEDLDAMRRILENLLMISFEQEGIMSDLNLVNKDDPLMTVLGQRQLNVGDDFSLVKDSLYALSKRVPQIGQMITKEITVIDKSFNESGLKFSERKIGECLRSQQNGLTSINNLAVLIDEIIQQMQEQKKKSGEGSCSKPGGGKPKPSMSESKKKQEELAKQMSKMKKGLQKGEKPGDKNPGKMGEGMSMQVAKLAAQQEQIRNELRKLRDEIAKTGDLSGAGDLKKLEELLERNEEDLVNFKLDFEFFERQKEIEVKMLQAENSMNERELEEKRESKSGVDYTRKLNTGLDVYLKNKSKELELLRMVEPGLSNYYKGKIKIFSY